MNWGEFPCRDPRITKKLMLEAPHAERGFQQLYGCFAVNQPMTPGTLLGVMTLRAGDLKANLDDVASVAGRTGLTVPTLHIEVLAVRQSAERQGVGQELFFAALQVAGEIRRVAGLYTVSVEATAESVPFYQALAFQSSSQVHPDGTVAMWYII